MRLKRRHFLAAGATAAGGAAVLSALWVSRSRSWPARFFRERFHELGRPILPASAKPNPAAWEPNRISISWLGQSTVLINFYGITILTDPVFSSRVGLDCWVGVLGPKRLVAPPFKPRELPPIDVLLISHAHWDHLDIPSLNAIPKPAFVATAWSTADILKSTRLPSPRELRWGERTRYSGVSGELEIEAFQVRHWGARLRKDTYRGYVGYILRREGRSLIFAGDTAWTPSFGLLNAGGPYDVAIMPIGSYHPWIRNHCTPEEAVRMADQAGARFVVPIHHSTFKLSEEPMNEPIERFQAALRSEPERIALRKAGETFVAG